MAVMSTERVATVGTAAATIPDDEWFGEGSAFDSGEDLAAALFALAGATRGAVVTPVEIAEPIPSAPDAESDFVEVRRSAAVGDARRANPERAAARAPGRSPKSWSIRAPGDQLLPPTVSGRSGWTIRNSVAVLHRTEEALARLREEAVSMAFLAAAEAVGRGRPASLERRRHPR